VQIIFAMYLALRLCILEEVIVLLLKFSVWVNFSLIYWIDQDVCVLLWTEKGLYNHRIQCEMERSPVMLVLSRMRDQSLMVGDDVEVTIVDIRGDKVRLGIKAPDSVSVHRREVYDAIRRENRGNTERESHVPVEELHADVPADQTLARRSEELTDRFKNVVGSLDEEELDLFSLLLKRFEKAAA
jgi:carbon storage regulator